MSGSGRVRSSTNGSVEHYFHFLLGYIVPMIPHLLQSQEPIRVLNCGPSMNALFPEVFGRLEINFKLWSSWRPSARPVALPRWDVERSELAQFLAASSALKQLLLRNPSCHQIDCDPAEDLILLRSPEPEYYSRKGRARISGYGSARRQIANISELWKNLKAGGATAKLYEPGRHSLACQALVFSSAQRIFGIRGAEWGNLIFSESGVKARIIFNGGRVTPLIPRLLEDLCIDKDFIVETESHPTISETAVTDFLGV